METTKNLKLPLYTGEDIFDLQNVNKAYDSIDKAYKEVIDFKNEIPKTNATAEVISARGGKKTLGERLYEFGSQLDTIQNKIDSGGIGGSEIDDTTPSTDKVYSSSKTKALIDEVAEKGTTVETITNVTKTVVNEKIADGTLSSMTIEDGTITEQKLSPDFLDKFMCASNSEIVSEMDYADRTTPLSANIYFGINKKINGEKIVKFSIHGKSAGTVNIAVFELLSDTQIKVTSINTYKVVIGRNDFTVNIPLNKTKDNYIAIEGVGSYSLDSNGYTFSQISKSNMQLGTVNSKFGTSNPMFIGLGIEVTRGGERVPLIDILRNDVDYLKNNSAKSKIKFDVLKSEDFKTSKDEWVYDNCTPSSAGLEFVGASECYMNKYNLYFDDSKQRVTFKLNDITTILGIGAKSNATNFTSYLVDFSEKKLKMFIHGTKADLSNATRIATSKAFDIPVVVGDMYTMLMTRESGIHTFELRHLKTSKTISVTFRTDQNKVNGSYYNLRSGSPSVIQLQGNSTITKYDYLVGNFNECECLFLGDSITEGLQTLKENRWCELLNKRYFNNKSVISGISGTNSSFVLMRLNELIGLGLKPKNVIVTIGTNDILSETGLNSWKNNIVTIYNKIVEIGAIPIIAVPPIYKGNFYPQLSQFILAKGWNTLRFDIATSSNGDGITQITNLFADGVHPNKDGGLAMYNQAIKDLEYIL